MAKTVKKAKKRAPRQNWCQMVIRVKVPRGDVKSMKVWRVTGVKPEGLPYTLEILNAYYDIPGVPNART